MKLLVRLLLGACAALAPVVPAAAEVTRTLTLELHGDPTQAFGVENLAGTMRVVPGSGAKVVATAVVHAESSALADLMRFEQVAGEKGIPTLRLRYPVDRYRTYRFGDGNHDEGFLAWLFDHGHSSFTYDGARVTVSGSRGVVLYAEVEVQLPRVPVDAHLRNAAGPMEGHDVQGQIKFDTGGGEIALSHVQGRIVADTGSGNVKADGIEGSFVCDTGSGACRVSAFKGDDMKCDTGSGSVEVRDAVARRVVIDTGSGDVRVHASDAEEWSADTGSGSVLIENGGNRLARIKADTGSGNVTLKLASDAAFEARAKTGSGDIRSGYGDAQAIVRGKEVVGYRRGDGRIRIDVDTGSGDFSVAPLP